MVLAKEIMSTPVKKIEWNKNVEEAAKIMSKYRIGSLVVVKNKKAIGLLTDSDIIKKVVSKNKKPSSVKVFSIMGRPLIKVYEDYPIEKIVDKMEKNNVKRLVVVNKKGEAVGLISLTDLGKKSSRFYEILAKRAEMKEREIVIREESAIGICDNCENYSDNLRLYNDKWLCVNCLDEYLEE